MACARKKLTAGKQEKRRRLLIIIPEVVEELHRELDNQNLNGREIKELHLALRGLANFDARLKRSDRVYDCHLSPLIGSKALYKVYFEATGNKNVSSFLEGDYREAEDAYGRAEMKVPVVLEHLYKRYKRFDSPVDDQEAATFKPHTTLPLPECFPKR